MSKPVLVDLFAEDLAHEHFLKPFVTRIAAEEQFRISVRLRRARGGHGRVLSELDLYQKIVEKGALPESPPELLVVVTDGNCAVWTRRRQEIRQRIIPSLSARLVVACPDPHIERWYLADPVSFCSVVGSQPTTGKVKCERDYYKNALARAVRQAGHSVLLGGVEFASELVSVMDLYRAGRNDRSLHAFVKDLRAKLREMRRP